MTPTVWDRIAEGNLGVKQDERFVVLRDEGIDVRFNARTPTDSAVRSPGMRGRMEEVPLPTARPGMAQERPASRPVELVTATTTGGHGREPHPEVWNTIFGAAAIARLDMHDVFDRLMTKSLTENDQVFLDEWSRQVKPLVPAAVLAVTNYSTSHTAFRRLLNAAGTRYASMPQFQPFLLRENGPLDIDPDTLSTRTRNLAAKLSGAKRIHITTPTGTDLHLNVEGRSFQPDDGLLTNPGSFGNLPAGEVYIAPIENEAQGTMVLEGGTRLTIKNGGITKIENGSDLTDLLRDHPDYLRVAELGIGTNHQASRADNILEAEKILGTVHIAFGDNSSFGGKQQIPYHVDHVLYQPTLNVDGRIIDLKAM